ncbi:hypothetical protein DFA_03407 [Cavenderia fasciculata]|uniref:Uncharacterized protein n=1 Tax=Cavenderia fasciculata TaxID=261658 RepID=F4PHH5_CACFS|nr:uncharacterized protein DFA_03407 [Cavenderia fasciculata]EGG25159.1 hypothetical protein DFA_03407 [Cavenderia fasciculata]|eukprot:XP_004363010.1 hypothetical protein DFA_03407 [Cavenderia fasciculata]
MQSTKMIFNSYNNKQSNPPPPHSPTNRPIIPILPNNNQFHPTNITNNNGQTYNNNNNIFPIPSPNHKPVNIMVNPFQSPPINSINSTDSTPSMSPKRETSPLPHRNPVAPPPSPSMNHVNSLHPHSQNHRNLSQSCPNTPTLIPYPLSPPLTPALHPNTSTTNNGKKENHPCTLKSCRMYMLSHSKDLFESGMDHFRQNGYWKLKQDNDPWEMKKEKVSRKSSIPGRGEKRKKIKESSNNESWDLEIPSHQLHCEKEKLLHSVEDLKTLLHHFNGLIEKHKSLVNHNNNNNNHSNNELLPSPLSSSPSKKTTTTTTTGKTTSGEEWNHLVATYHQIEETFDKLNSMDNCEGDGGGGGSPKQYSQQSCSPLNLATPTMGPMPSSSSISGDSQTSTISVFSSPPPSQLSLESVCSSSSSSSSSPPTFQPPKLLPSIQHQQSKSSMSITALIQDRN